MNPDESEWAWWMIFLATEGASFKRHTGTASHLTDKPSQWEGAAFSVHKHPTGGINHQNTCGHGFTWRESFHLIEHPQGGARGRLLPATRSKKGGTGGRTLLGASPSEIRFRDHFDHQKRWSSK